ncbi:PAQR family membrane homeostasis protein TrhA [Nitrosovibrio sp. Nv4]|uniref:PAQR family membrane homeostasis protein TrhA n=1 Tax=Nitrosovibrio sp. Nv4 TaxID=1945880 RepID=UPI000BD50EE0|nr:hemolysin III family protein [Nitrosovibrio sp. Nv4]SOD40239.1 hemolysin III [Nitrosovibrio sp. Nv4]
MRILLAGPMREQSRAEEIANSISHGIALVAAFVGSPFLITHAARHGDTAFLIGTCLFSATTILLYLSSTLYHAFPAGKTKRVFRVFEHSAIFLLIAGTYTPFTLGVLRGAWGWTLFGVVWSLAIAGVALKVFSKRPHPIFSTSLYLLMGWLVLIAIEPLSTRMPAVGMSWLVAGGLSYTIGVIFFATDSRLLYGHLIWHLFVIAGTACHFIAVLWYGA